MPGTIVQTITPGLPVYCRGWATVVGEKEGQGPCGKDFDTVLSDYLYGEKTWEKAECKMLKEAVLKAASAADLVMEDVQLLLAGDLLNQTITANYAARDLGVPFLGLYGACSTMAESVLLASILVGSGSFSNVTCAVSSHHQTAERQYRYPIEQGVQRPPSSQWTVTAAGALVLAANPAGPVQVVRATVGKVIDGGQSDANDMGSAMSLAAADTILAHFRDSGLKEDYYDLVLTGDLGMTGLEILSRLLARQGLTLGNRLSDCGALIFDPRQGTMSGGSGCGCAAAMLCGPVLKRMARGELTRVLLVATGALMSPLSLQQGETIPAVAHAVAFEKVST